MCTMQPIASTASCWVEDLSLNNTEVFIVWITLPVDTWILKWKWMHYKWCCQVYFWNYFSRWVISTAQWFLGVVSCSTIFTYFEKKKMDLCWFILLPWDQGTETEKALSLNIKVFSNILLWIIQRTLYAEETVLMTIVCSVNYPENAGIFKCSFSKQWAP